MEGKILLVGLLALMVFFSGCVCCSCNSDLGKLLGGGNNNGGGVFAEGCQSPYIQVGSECCIDQNSNGVCDLDETTEDTGADETTTTEAESTQTTQTTETTLAETQTTSTVEATQTTLKSTYSCVQAAGYDPDEIIFEYSQGCGSNFIADASMVSIATGVTIKPMNIGGLNLDEKKKKALECFYGT